MTQPVLQREDPKAKKRAQKSRNREQRRLEKAAAKGDVDLFTLAQDLAAATKDADEAFAAAESAALQHLASLPPEQARLRALEAGEVAANRVFDAARPEVSALRPLKYDPYDRRLRETERAKNEDMAVRHSEVGAKLTADAAVGGLKTPEAALKEVLAERAEERHHTRVAGGGKPHVQGQPQRDPRARNAALNEAVQAKQAKSGPSKDANDERQRQAKAEKEIGSPVDKTLSEVGETVSLAGTGAGGISSVVTAGAGVFGVRAPKITEDQYKNESKGVVDQTAQADTSAFSLLWIQDLADCVSGLISFVQKCQRASRGKLDRADKVDLVRSGIVQLRTMTKTTSDLIKGSEHIIRSFGTQGDVARGFMEQGQTARGMWETTPIDMFHIGGTALLPGLGLAVSALGLMADFVGVVPVIDRFAGEFEAVVHAKTVDDPVALSALGRMRSATVVQIEKSVFSMIKNMTNIGLHIAELASGGGWGAPAGARLGVLLIDVLHTAAHLVRQVVEEEVAARAKRDYFGAHKEGAAKRMVERDPGTAVDVMVHAAQRSGSPSAAMVLETYGVRPQELGTMGHDEIRNKVLKQMDQEGDPKLIAKKIDDAKKAAGELLHGDEETGKKSLSQTVGDLNPFGQDAKQSRADLERLVQLKNKHGYKDRTDRTNRKPIGEDTVDKSYAKLREWILVKDPTTPLDRLPYSHREEQERQRRRRRLDANYISEDLRKLAEQGEVEKLRQQLQHDQRRLRRDPEKAVSEMVPYQVEWLQRQIKELSRA